MAQVSVGKFRLPKSIGGGRMVLADSEDGSPLQRDMMPGEERLPEISEAEWADYVKNQDAGENLATGNVSALSAPRKPAISIPLTVPRRTDMRPVDVRQAAKPDTSEMLARIAGTAVDGPAADSMHPAIKAVLGAAQPKPATPQAEHPAIQAVLAGADKEMQLARALSAMNRAGAKISHAADPLWAATLGERDDGRRLQADLAEADRPIQDLQERRADRAQLAAQADATAKRDPNSEYSKRLRQAIGGGDPAMAAAIDGMSAAEIERISPLLVKRFEAEASRNERAGAREDQQRFQAEQNALGRQNSRDIANLTASLRQQDKLDEREVGGLEFAPGRTPSKKSADEMTQTVVRAKKILSDLGRMRDIYKTKGAEFGFGADRATSNAAREGTMLQLKELENLGVLNGRDLEVLSKIVPDPNSMRGVLDKKGMDAQFDEFERQLRGRVQANAEARGYRVTDPGLAGAPSGKVVVSNGKETLEIDAADLGDAEKEGFRRVGG